MRAIIIAAGEATRWANHMGTPKHLVRVDGESILHRTVRLLSENGVDDVWVVSKDDARYSVQGTKQYIVEPDYETNADADKFLSSVNLWRSGSERVLIIYGDCYFTDEAMRIIVNASSRRKDWMLFCRPHKSKVTGSRYGECFCYSFTPDEHGGKIEKELNRLVRLYKEDKIDRIGGWELYRAMSGVSDNKLRVHRMYGNWYLIDDWTDDFDYPEDYDKWMMNRYGKEQENG